MSAIIEQRKDPAKDQWIQMNDIVAGELQADNKENKSNILELPTEIIHMIFTYLSFWELKQVALVHPRFLKVSGYAEVWKEYHDSLMSDLEGKIHFLSRKEKHQLEDGNGLNEDTNWREKITRRAQLRKHVLERAKKVSLRKYNFQKRLRASIVLIFFLIVTLFLVMQYLVRDYFWVVLWVPVCLLLIGYGVLDVVVRKKNWGFVLGGNCGRCISFVLSTAMCASFGFLISNFTVCGKLAEAETYYQSIANASLYKEVGYYSFSDGILATDYSLTVVRDGYMCLAPIYADQDENKTVVYAWAVCAFSGYVGDIPSEDVCRYATEAQATECLAAWSPFYDYNTGISLKILDDYGYPWYKGYTEEWRAAVATVVETYGIVSVENAPLMQWGVSASDLTNNKIFYGTWAAVVVGVCSVLWLIGMVFAYKEMCWC